MIVTPRTDEYAGRYRQFIWSGPLIDDPFMNAAQQILHLPSNTQSFQMRNLFWGGLSRRDISQLFQSPHGGCSFEQLMTDRAVELAQRSLTLEVPVYILWSGGIDSTATLLACLPVFKEMNVPYKIVCTPLAKEEYARMFDEVKDDPNTIIISPIGFYDTVYDFYKEGIVATGFCGDQLGSSTVSTCYGGNQDVVIKTPWQKFIMQRFPDAFEQMSNYVEATGLNIRNAFELGWTLSIAIKWDFVTYNTILWCALSKGAGTKLPVSHNFPFFSSPAFRSFAIDYYKKNGLGYKNQTRPFTKDYILSMNGDVDYHHNKRKEATMFNIKPHMGLVDKQFATIEWSKV